MRQWQRLLNPSLALSFKKKNSLYQIYTVLWTKKNGVTFYDRHTLQLTSVDVILSSLDGPF